MKQDPTYQELVDFARWTQTFWKSGIEIMRKNGLVIKSDTPMEKLAFTFYSDLCEIDVKAAHLFNEGYGDKNYKDETAIQAQTITRYPKPYEERIRESVLEEIEKIVDGAISGLYKGTEDVISAHARHKAFSWVKMKIQELRNREETR